MVCPKCMVQMHQAFQEEKFDDGTIKRQPLGGGSAEEDSYKTWTIQKCPQCKKLIKESYSAIEVDDAEIHMLVETNLIV